MAKVKGSVRTTQLITTYGIGSLVAVDDESFIVSGLESWSPNAADEIDEPRLKRRLRVARFYRPPASGDAGRPDIPVRRFPTWYSCPGCERLAPAREFGNKFGESLVCNLCDDGFDLIPSRFVVACASGHLDDFPFDWWVHADSPHPPGGRGRLRISNRGATSGLKDIEISCDCGATRSLEGAFGKAALGNRGCFGRRPWLDDVDPLSCSADRRVLQRGATNVWFSCTESAISIPPWSEQIFQVIDRNWDLIRNLPPDVRALVVQSQYANETTTAEDILDAIAERLEEPETDLGDLKAEEYEALIRPRHEEHRDQQFVCTTAEIAPALQPLIQRVSQVRRLRMVRALTGFTRLHPGSGTPSTVAPLSIDDNIGWLPAIEVRGEGVFLTLAQDALSQWEQRNAVAERYAKLNQRYLDACARLGNTPAATITPRRVLLHSLAHALIDQWALVAGYPAASLAERLYISDSMAGLLIFTATSDSAGSLGGLVALAEELPFQTALTEALMRATWCSQDPLCMEAESRGVDALNLAACHSCQLLPEPSCEHANSFLDRASLVGEGDESDLGYFAELLDRPTWRT